MYSSFPTKFPPNFLILFQTLSNYEYSVQSSLIQHGMTREDLNSVEHVQDIKELEYLLNDSLAKQRVEGDVH